jgi:TolA-binding protein
MKLDDADADSDGNEDDKCSNEMLQKRLRTLTDEKEIKKLKRCDSKQISSLRAWLPKCSVTVLSKEFCRLLRNRVSAQQARERKKQYINDLEDQMKDKDKEIQKMSAKLQELSDENKTLSTDNRTLRRLIVTMRGQTPQSGQKTVPGASATRLGRPMRQDAPHGSAMPSSQPIRALQSEYSGDSHVHGTRV